MSELPPMSNAEILDALEKETARLRVASEYHHRGYLAGLNWARKHALEQAEHVRSHADGWAAQLAADCCEEIVEDIDQEIALDAERVKQHDQD